MKKKILIAGVGNLLFTDEGVGVHIIRELSKKELPEEVELAEIGTATFELIRLVDGKGKVIIIDAIISDETPGAIYRLTPEELKSDKKKLITSLHQFGVLEALESAFQLGDKPEVIIFGITPKDYQTLGMELTPELKKSMDRIVEAILKEIK
ncbi:MAG: hydrogenase maturation protease [candidate division Zixibacteria bacterium]|nr:hydrogenase maturation protease [candidate division Zixibacteria bacterium]